MNCCATDNIPTEKNFEQGSGPSDAANLEKTETAIKRCPACQGQSRSVSLKTVLLTIDSELLDECMRGMYRSCLEPERSVIYFDERSSRVLTSSNLRFSAAGRATGDTIPLCYCFGFDESHIRAEISRTGQTTIPGRLSRLIREGLCACESRNPAGVCCLGELNKAVNRLTAGNQIGGITKAPQLSETKLEARGKDCLSQQHESFK